MDTDQQRRHQKQRHVALREQRHRQLGVEFAIRSVVLAVGRVVTRVVVRSAAFRGLHRSRQCVFVCVVCVVREPQGARSQDQEGGDQQGWRG